MKKIFSFFLLLVGVWMLFEFVSFLTLTVLHGGVPDFTAMQKTRSQILTPAEKEVEQALFELPAALHPYLGVVHNPDVPMPTHLYSGFGVSDYGFFDDKDPVMRQKKNRFIVGVLGGSVAWWASTLARHVLIEELQKSPALQGKEIVIIRAALGGYKEPQQVTGLAYLLTLGAQFDAIVNIDGFNEITLPFMHNVNKGINPTYPTYWNDVLGPHAGAFDNEWLGRHALFDGLRKKSARIANREVLKKSPTVNLVWQLSERILGSKLAQMKLEHQKSKTDTPKLPYFLRGPAFDKTEDVILRNMAKNWRRGSVLLAAMCKARGIEYFHFLQPNQYVPGSKPLTAEEKKKAYDERSEWRRLAQAGYPLLRAEIPRLLAEGVRFADLTQLFMNDRRTLYIDNCCHVNLEGNAVLAKVIADALKSVFEQKPATSDSDETD